MIVGRVGWNFPANDKLKMYLKIEKHENCTIIIRKGNSYFRRKSSIRGPRFKVSSEGLSTEINILIFPPIQAKTEADVA